MKITNSSPPIKKQKKTKYVQNASKHVKKCRYNGHNGYVKLLN